MTYTAEDIIEALTQMRNEEQRQVLCRFFKTGKGEYGEGDQFLGLKVPQTRSVARMAKLHVPPEEIKRLLYSPWHEVRLCGFLLLVEEMKAALPRKGRADGGAPRRREIAYFYLVHARQANNWDLVDLSCPYIIGQWLWYTADDGAETVLDRLAQSSDLWEQRIAIVSTMMLIRHGRFGDALRISLKLLDHPHDLIHKAVGWMLREVGKRDATLLREFLAANYSCIHRTTLRYAIEKFSPAERCQWLNYNK